MTDQVLREIRNKEKIIKSYKKQGILRSHDCQRPEGTWHTDEVDECLWILGYFIPDSLLVYLTLFLLALYIFLFISIL